MLLKAGSLWSWQRKKCFMSCLIRWLSWKSKITWQPLPSSKEPSQTQLLFICIYTLAVAWHGRRGIWFALQCLDTDPVGEVGVEMGWATDLVFCLPLGSFSEFVTWHSSQPFEALSPKATNVEPPRPRWNHHGCYLPTPIQGSFLSADLHSLFNTHNTDQTLIFCCSCLRDSYEKYLREDDQTKKKRGNIFEWTTVRGILLRERLDLQKYYLD